jgi:hypothetical protein
LAFHAQGALNLNHAAEQHRAAVCDFTNGKENMALNELSKAIAFEEVQRTFEIPCPILRQLIGQALAEMQQANSRTLKSQLGSAVRSLEQLYEKQCARLERTQLGDPIGARASMWFANGVVLLTLVTEPAAVVTVLAGGSDGILVTIDHNGTILVLPPKGPGEPDVRLAVESMLQGVNVLSGLAAAAPQAASLGGSNS